MTDINDLPVFETSPETAKIDAALAKAQAEITAAPKDKENPHFRSKYADLASVWSACRDALTKNGISVTQWPLHSSDNRLHIITRLACGGEWIKGRFSIPVGKQDAHGYGSATTYAKRFSLAAAVGVVADEDDDGNGAADKKGGNVEAMGTGKHRDDIGAGDSWREWALAPKGSDCEKWLKGVKTMMSAATSVEAIDDWMRAAEAAKRIRALHDHHQERYDWLMGLINGVRDELRAKAA